FLPCPVKPETKLLIESPGSFVFLQDPQRYPFIPLILQTVKAKLHESRYDPLIPVCGMKVYAPDLPASVVQIVVPTLSDADEANDLVFTDRDEIPFIPPEHCIRESFFPAFCGDLVKKRVRNDPLICCLP